MSCICSRVNLAVNKGAGAEMSTKLMQRQNNKSKRYKARKHHQENNEDSMTH